MLKLKDINPIADYLLIEVFITDKKTPSGLYTFDDKDEKTQRGKVVRCNGLIVKAGDTIVFKKFSEEQFPFKIDNKEYLFIKTKDVLAVISK